MVPVLVRRWLQIGCQYILVFRPSQGLQQLLIAHLYILVCRLSLGLQSLPLEFLYTLVLVAPVQDLRLLQTARLYRLVCQSFLVPPKPLTGHPQPLDQLFPVRRSHQLGFPDTQVMERLARVQRLLLLGCLYRLVFQLSLGLQQLLIAHLYILVRKHGSLVRRWSQLEFPCTLVVELLVLVQQSLRIGCLYKMVSMVSVLVRRWHQLEFPCTLVVELLALVQQLLRTGHLQPLVPAFQVQQWHQIEFPCTLVVELLAQVRQ